MSHHRLAYDDAATTDQMAADCAAVDQALRPSGQLLGNPHGHLPDQRAALPHPAKEAVHDTVVVSDDLAALAAGLELHLD